MRRRSVVKTDVIARRFGINEPLWQRAHAQRQRAYQQAWNHVEQVLKAGTARATVIAKYGLGDLQNEGHYRYHGSEHEDHIFAVHPKRPSLKHHGMWTWRPGYDTLIPARQFCCNCKPIRAKADGTQPWQCQGHDVGFEGKAPTGDFPANLSARPLAGKRLVECYSGNPDAG